MAIEAAKPPAAPESLELCWEFSMHALASRNTLLGDTYPIVDMNVWGWARLIPTVLGDSGWEKFPNLKRLVEEIGARPAAQKAVARHKFKTEMDDEALQAMFPHLKVKAA